MKRPKTRTERLNMKGINLTNKNGMWRGDGVGYGALHDFIKFRLTRPNKCQQCGKIGKVDLANISQNYRRDVNDWEWVCRKCHMVKFLICNTVDSLFYVLSVKNCLK